MPKSLKIIGSGVVVWILAFIVAGFLIMGLAKGGAIASYPWMAIGVALAIVGAVTTLIAGIAEANIGTHQTGKNKAQH